jgi:hypothetical protein
MRRSPAWTKFLELLVKGDDCNISSGLGTSGSRGVWVFDEDVDLDVGLEVAVECDILAYSVSVSDDTVGAPSKRWRRS